MNNALKIVAVSLITGIMLIGCLNSTSDEKNKVLFRRDVFVGGQDGYHTYRIPALVRTNDNTLLAFCEGRKNSGGDEGDIDLLLKRSSDGGRTWSKQIVVHEEGGDAPITIGNPCPILEGSTIHLLFTRNNKRLFYTQSNDDGLTWQMPQEFTHIMRETNYPWIRIATGPVHGILLKNGRLVVPIWMCDRERKDRNAEPAKDRYRSGTIYSDDSGMSWKIGKLVPAGLNCLNEATVVERIDSSLLLNMRATNEGFRAISTSTNGGESWSNPVLDKALPCPTCQASMIRYSKNEILFLNPAGPERRNLTLRLSLDDGKTWADSRLVEKEKSAYSDIAIGEDNSIYCLFENGKERYSEKISYVKVTKNWIKGEN